MICWDCYWGWPLPVFNAYQKALSALGGDDFPLKFGPSHLVWEDENFDSAEWCLVHFDEYRGDFNDFELEIVRQSLIELESIPIDERCLTPDDYDGEHPELYPPIGGVEMIRV